MTCPEVGRWRTWLDHESLAGDTAGLESHLAACPACRSTVANLRQNAAVANRAIDRLGASFEFRVPNSEFVARLWSEAAAREASDTDSDAEDPAHIPLLVSATRTSKPEPRKPNPKPRYPDPETQHPTTSTQHPELGTRNSEPGTRTLPKEIDTMTLARTTSRWRVALGGLAAALILTFLIGTPQGRTATAQFLAQFRSQRFTAVTIDPGQQRTALVELERLGTIQGTSPTERATTVASIGEASQMVGFTVKQPDPAALPPGISGTPRVQVSPASDLRFTFDQAKARAYFDSIGQSDVSLPDRFHGATLVVSVPAAVLLQYPTADNSGSGLLIGQAKELTVGVEGNVTLDELRDFLINLPGVSPELRSQLKGITDWQRTMPIPIPEDQVGWQEGTIAGRPGLILADNTGIGSGAIWNHDGRVYGVAGRFRTTEIQRVANSLN